MGFGIYAKHIIVNPTGLPEGLIDWGDTHIGHPGIDLSIGFMIFDELLRKEFFKSYGDINHKSLKIASFRSFCHSIVAFAYFKDINEISSIEWTKAALNNSIKAITSAG